MRAELMTDDKKEATMGESNTIDRTRLDELLAEIPRALGLGSSNDREFVLERVVERWDEFHRNHERWTAAGMVVDLDHAYVHEGDEQRPHITQLHVALIDLCMAVENGLRDDAEWESGLSVKVLAALRQAHSRIGEAIDAWVLAAQHPDD